MTSRAARPLASLQRRVLFALVLAGAALGGANVSHAQQEVPSDWSLIPSGLGAGDSFRLLFVTSTTRSAASSTIGDYDTHVRTAAAAGHADIRAYSTHFKVLGSTASVDARDHTETTYTASNKGVPIYWLNGAIAADNYEDLYDGTWAGSRSNELGAFVSSFLHVNTGSKNDGTKHANPLGSTPDVRYGIRLPAGQVLSSGNASRGLLTQYYALSGVFTVASATAPPPPAAPTTLVATAGDTEVTLSWDAPDAGADITGHEYRYKTDGDYPDTWETIDDSAPGEDHEDGVVVTGLTNGLLHTFQVRAVNNADPGPESVVTATPIPAISIQADARTNEDGGSILVCMVSSNPGRGLITANLTITEGTATNPEDYTGDAVTAMRLRPFQKQSCISVAVVDDDLDEGDEDFTATLSDPVNTTLGTPASVPLTIVDNDEALAVEVEVEVLHNNLAVTALPENAGTATIRVTATTDVNRAPAEAINFSIYSRSGTAVGSPSGVSSGDYTVFSQPLTYAAAEFSQVQGEQHYAATKTLTLTINDDALVEEDETFTLVIQRAPDTPAYVTLPGSLTITIEDDDAALPVVTIAAGDPVTEGDDAEFTLTRTGSTASELTVTVTVSESGEMVAASDEGEKGVMFEANSATATHSVATETDTTNEDDSTVTVTVVAGDGYVAGDPDAAGLTILDNDLPPVNVVFDVPAEVREDIGTLDVPVVATTTVNRRPKPPIGGITVSAVAGSADSPEDYGRLSGQVRFSAGEAWTATADGEGNPVFTQTATLSLPIVDDLLDEPDEFFRLRLQRSPFLPQAISLASSATIVTITDNDEAPSVSVADGEANEADGSVDFVISLSAASGKTVQVAYAASTEAGDTATAGTDYTAVAATTLTFTMGETEKTVSVAVRDDGEVEADETFTVTLTLPADANATLGDATATGTITNDDAALPVVTIAAGDPVTEGDDAEFTLTRTGSTASELTVTVTVSESGEMVAASDEGEKGVTFEANSATATHSVATETDTTNEDDSTVTVTVVAGDGYVAGDPDAAGLTILDNDLPPVNVVFDVPAEVREDIGTLDVPVVATTTVNRRPKPPIGGITVSAVAGSADSPEDYGRLSGQVRFSAGEAWTATADGEGNPVFTQTATLSLPIVDDLLDEPDEFFRLRLQRSPFLPQAISLASSATIVTITDNDEAPSVSVADGEANEADGSVDFVISLSAASGKTVQVAYAASTEAGDTATAGTDYTAVAATTLTFTMGETEKTVSVAVRDDGEVEADETFTVTLTLPADANATLGDATATGTITNDDAALPVVTIAAGDPVTEGTAATFTLDIAPKPANTTTYTVTYTVGESGNMVAAGDKGTGKSLSFIWNASSGARCYALSAAQPACNDSARVVSVPTVGDTTTESASVVTVTMTAVTGGGATLAAMPSAMVTIEDDDGPPPAPTNLTATGGDAQVTLGWTAPASDAAITGHEYRYREGMADYEKWSIIPMSAPGEMNQAGYIVTGLTNTETYTFQVRAENSGRASGPSNDVTVRVGAGLGICDRSRPVRLRLLYLIDGVTDCARVTAAHLAAIVRLDIGYRNLSGLKAGDFAGLSSLTGLFMSEAQMSRLPAGVFDGLSSLTSLSLSRNRLGELPAGVFSGLSSLTVLSMTSNRLGELPAGVFSGLPLTQLQLGANRLRELPAGVFSGLPLTQLTLSENLLAALPPGVFSGLPLTQLNLRDNQLEELPAGVFDGLPLTRLNLRHNRLGELPAGVFSGQSALTQLYLDNNQLGHLPSGVFDGLPLTELDLASNQLRALPAGVFSGQSSLMDLFLGGNSVSPLPLTVSLALDGDGQFKATAREGAPFAIVLPVVIANGTVDGGAGTITIPAGALESGTGPAVIRTPGTTSAVTADIGTPPGLPARHSGYALFKSSELPLEVLAALAAGPAVMIAPGPSPVDEGTAATFTLSRTGATTAPLTVTVGVTETGAMISGSAPTSVEFTANNATATLTVETAGDALDEADSVITAAVTAASGYTVAAPISAMVTVNDDDRLPGAPTGLGAAAAGQTAINLSWTAPANPGTSPIGGYRIEVSTDGTAWTDLAADTGNTATTYEHSGLTAGSTRHYRVSAISAAGTGAASASVSAATHGVLPEVTIAAGPGPVDEGTPATFTLSRTGATTAALTVTVGVTETGATISGSAPTSAEFTATDATATLTVETAGDALDEADSVITAAVTAASGYTVGTPSSAMVTVNDDDVRPAAPTGLGATADGQTAIDLRWTAPGAPGTSPIGGYRIEVSTDGTTWTDLAADTGNTATAYEHTGLTAGSTRHYRVSAISAAGTGPASASDSATTDAATQTASTVTLTSSYLGLGTGDATFCIGLTPPAGETLSRDEQDALFAGVSVTNGRAVLLPHCLALETSVGGGVLGIPIDPGAGVDTVTIALPADTVATDASTTAAPEYFAADPLTVKVALDGNTVTAAGTPATVVPGAPTNVTVDSVGQTQLNVSWLAPTGPGIGLITGYKVEVSETGAAPWTGLGGTLAATDRSYHHTGLTAGTTRHYRVLAVNAIGDGAWSAVQSATTEAATVLPEVTIAAGPGPVDEGTPATFTLSRTGATTAALTVTVGVTETGATISGSAPTSAEFTATDATATLTVETAGDALDEADSVITAAVTAASGYTVGTPSSAMVTVNDDDVRPAAPTGLGATADGQTAIDLRWTAPGAPGTSPIGGYRIEVSTDGTTWTDLAADTGNTATAYEHTGLTAGSTRHYRVSAISAAGTGPASASDSATTDAATQTASTVTLTSSYLGLGTGDATFCIGLTPPAGETLSRDEQDALFAGVSVTNGRAVLLPHCLALETSVGGGVLGIPIDPGAGVDTVTIALPADTVATDASTTAAPEYFAADPLTVKVALDGNTVTAAGTPATVVPGAPTNVTVDSVGQTQLNVSWLAPTGPGIGLITGYKVEVSETGAAPWTGLGGTLAATDRSYHHTGLTAGTTRHYRVLAVNAIGDGAWSAVQSATTEAATVLPEVTIAAGPGPVDEGTPATFTLSRTGATTAALTVTVGVTETGATISGSAPTSAEFTATDATATLTVETAGDALDEADSVITAAVTAASGYTVGTPSSAMVTVNDDDVRPAAPTGLGATADGQTAIDLRWTAPGAPGTSPIGGYRIEVSTDGTTWTDLAADTGNTATAYEHTGLTAGSTRHYRVSAISAAGTGPASASDSATTDAATQTASTVTLTSSYLGLGTGDATFCIGLTPPAGETLSRDEQDALFAGVSVTNGRAVLLPHCLALETSVGGGVLGIPIDPGAGVDTVTIALPADTVATDASTTSAPEYFAADPLTVNVTLSGSTVTGVEVAGARLPGAPRGVYTEAGNAQLTLYWSPVDDDGADIEMFQYQQRTTGPFGTDWTDIPDSAKPDPDTAGSGANFQSYVITSGVANGTTYRYRLRAVNAAGAGPPSSEFIGRPVAAPGPNTVTATQAPPTVNGWDGVSTLDMSRKFLTYFEFGEAMRGFTPSDVSVTNGRAVRVLVESARRSSTTGDPNQIHASTYAVEIQPAAAGEVTVSLPAGKVFSAGGKGNSASNSLTYNYVVSTVRPQVLITEPFGCEATGNGFCVMVVFHDRARDIPVRGFEATELTLTNGEVASLVSHGRWGYSILEGNEAVQYYAVWHAVIQPESGYTGPFTVSMAEGVVQDYSGNTNLPMSPDTHYTTTVTSGSSQQQGATRSPIAGFTLFDNAAGGADVMALTDGAALAALSSERLNIRAEAAAWTEIGSVRMELSGAVSSSRTEGIAPYALFGDRGGRAFPAGTYTVTATAYPERNLGGTPGPARSVTFTVAGAVAAPSVTVTSGAEGPVSGEFSVTVRFSEPVTGFRMSELAIANGRATRSASLTDRQGYATEYEVYVAPDAGASGEITVTVPAGVAADADGNPNTASAVFRIALASVWDPLTGFTLFDNAAGGADVRALSDGTVLRGLVSGQLNVRANARSGASIGSVRMALSGAMSSSRTEGIAPYALFGDRGGRAFAPGSYTVTATPYPERDLGGTAGKTRSVTFRVVLPALSVADARAEEGTDETIDFAVTLDAASRGRVTVDYATSDGTATAGADYTSTSGTLTFDAGETAKTVSVPVLDDSHDEDSETLTLTLSNPSGATIADGTATGTITNSDAMPRAWIARFGRTVAEQVVDGVQARLTAPRTPGVEATLAGQRIGGSGAGSMAPRDDAGLGAAGDTEARLEALSEWLRNDADGDRARLGSRTVSDRELLTGTSFALTGEAGAAGGGSAALWGRGAISSFDGRDGKLTLDGEVGSLMLGADWTRDAWTAGLMLSHARGEGGYRGAPGSGSGAGGEGKVESDLTGLYPYGRYAVSERVTLWGVAGYGAGSLTLTPKGQSPIETDMDLAMGAVGIRGVVVRAPAEGGPELAVKSDALVVRTTSEKTAGLAAAEADVTRLRLGLEGTWRGLKLGSGELTPSLEAGVRHDGGDAETGFGVDLGGGLAWSDPASGIAAEIRGRGLLTHAAGGFREQGYSGALTWDPRPDSDRGMKLTLQQTVGASATGGMDALLGRGTLAGLAANDDGDELQRRRLEVRLVYGLSAFGDRFTSTPELGLGLSDTGRDYSLGWRLGLARGGGTSLDLKLEATRRESANDNDAEHGIGFRLTARW